MSSSSSSTTRARRSESFDKMLPFAFDLPSTSLVYVSNEKHVQELGLAMKEAILIGIDTETKPTFVPKRFLKGPPHPTSIMQIAVRSHVGKECVYVVDLLKIRNTPTLLLELDLCLQASFLNAKCLKLGQGLTNDLREMAVAYPNVQAFQLVHSVLETHDVVKYLQPVIINPISLKNLVKQYLHYDLQKTEQMSDWARRPLTESQLHYAACDALVLIRLYDAMHCEIEEKLSTAGSESGNESETSQNPYNSGFSAATHATMASLSKTVDFRKLVKQNLESSQRKDKKMSKHEKRQQRAHGEGAMAGLDLNSALLRGWQSTAQREWLQSRTVVQVEGIAGSAAGRAAAVVSSSSSSGCSGAAAVGGKRSVEGSKLPAAKQQRREAGTGSHQVHHVVSTASLPDAAVGASPKQKAHLNSAQEEGHVGLPSSTGVHTVFVHQVAVAE